MEVNPGLLHERHMYQIVVPLFDPEMFLSEKKKGKEPCKNSFHKGRGFLYIYMHIHTFRYVSSPCIFMQETQKWDSMTFLEK